MHIKIKAHCLFLVLTVLFLHFSSSAQKASRVKSVSSICDSVIFNYTANSSVKNAAFVWVREVINGIQNIKETGTDKINETLINTTINPITVKYVFYITSEDGCTHTDTLKVIVLSSVHTNNIVQNQNICDSSKISFIPKSNTKASTYLWVRNLNVGISNPAKKGSTPINEILLNTTTDIINVPYYITTSTTYGCQATDTMNINIIPKPFGKIEITPNVAVFWGDNVKFYFNSSDTIPYTYMWNFVDGSVIKSKDNPINHFIYSSSIGIKPATLIVTNSFGCTKPFQYEMNLSGDSSTVPLPSNAYKKNYTIAAYPIPFTTTLYLKYNVEEAHTARYIVNDLAGRIIYNEEIKILKGSNTIILSSAKLQMGMVYNIKIKSKTIDYEEKVFRK